MNYVHLLSTHAQLLTNANHKAASQFIYIYECGQNNLLNLKTNSLKQSPILATAADDHKLPVLSGQNR